MSSAPVPAASLTGSAWLLPLAALFWGWQTGLWLPGAALAGALALAWQVPPRPLLGHAAQARLSDLCAVLLVLGYGGFYLWRRNPAAMLLLFRFAPLLLCPLVLCRPWYADGRLDLRALVWALRGSAEARGSVDPAPAFTALLLLAAATGNQPGPGYLAGACLLAGLALWPVRRRGSGGGLWWVAMAAALALTVPLQAGLHRAQLWLEDAVADWLDLAGSHTDPWSSVTAIGTIGRLKTSARIVLRAWPATPHDIPLLLRRASYDHYAGGTWTTPATALQALPGPDSGGRWALEPPSLLPSAPAPATGTWTLRVVETVERPDPLLSLPARTAWIAGPGLAALRASPLGTVRTHATPGYLAYTATTIPAEAGGPPPGPADQAVGRAERLALAPLLADPELATSTAPELVARLPAYFRAHFRYALPTGTQRAPTLGQFLRRDHQGHCEYFATATVLLLRAAGVPARYATGYSVQEYSRLEQAYVARARHAHAWAQAWVGGRWVDVDTTPPDWTLVEAGEGPGNWAGDLAAWAAYRLQRLQEESGRWALGAAAALALGWVLVRVVWPLRAAMRGATGRASAVATPAAVATGADSEFYAVLAHLAGQGRRPPAETPLATWIAALAAEGPDARALPALAGLHLRHRFDPQGLAAAERQQLRDGCSLWLRTHAARPQEAQAGAPAGR